MEGREKAETSGRRAVDKSRPRASQVAPKTTVTIDQIRRLALKKHMPTLQRLVVNYFDRHFRGCATISTPLFPPCVADSDVRGIVGRRVCVEVKRSFVEDVVKGVPWMEEELMNPPLAWRR